MGYEHLIAAIISQTKYDYMKSIWGGRAERQIERDIRSKYWQRCILGGVVEPKDVIKAWKTEKFTQMKLTGREE